ncbi:MAG: hypothetical protein FWH20_05650 [Oscillospiraceae bacterium]|nr:hypothetical protein [Oscillospiraceae bacterium]
MKRIATFCISAVLLAAVLVLPACKSDKEVVPETHDFTLVTLAADADINLAKNLSGMDAYHTGNEMALFYFKSDAYDETERNDIVNKVYDDLITISNVSGRRMERVNIYFFDSDTEMTTHFYNNGVFVNKADIDGEELRSALAGAAFGVTEPWLAYGIAAHVFKFSVNERTMWNFWENARPQNTLMLFGSRFTPGFYPREDLNLSRDIAASLADYVIENHGWSELLDKGDTYKGEWLSANGIDIWEANAEFENELRGFKHYSSDEFPGILETDIGVYFISPEAKYLVRTNHETIIYGERKSREFLRNFIGENLSSNKEMFDLSLLENLHFYRMSLSEMGDKDAYYDGKSLYIRQDNFFYLGELIKQLYDADSFPEAFHPLSNAVSSYIAFMDIGSYNFIFLQSAFALDATSEFDVAAEEFYQARSTAEEFIDPVTATHAQAYASFLHGNTPIEDTITGLSETQLLSFVMRLVELYTLDTVFDLYANDTLDFAGVFGKDYTELRDEWLAFLGVASDVTTPVDESDTEELDTEELDTED